MLFLVDKSRRQVVEFDLVLLEQLQAIVFKPEPSENGLLPSATSLDIVIDTLQTKQEYASLKCKGSNVQLEKLVNKRR